MVTTRDVVAALEELARLTVLDDGNPNSFRARAYEKAARGLESAGVEVAALTVEEMEDIPGVGRSIAEKIRELVETGSIRKLEELRASYPRQFVQMSRIPGVGPKTLKLLRQELGIEDLEGLRAAIAAQQLRHLPGLGATTEEKIARALERMESEGEERRTPVGEALGVAQRLVDRLRQLPGVERVEAAGSLRRFQDTVGDLDIVVAAGDPERVMAAVTSHPSAAEVIATGPAKTSLLTHSGLQVDVRVVRPDQWGAALLYFTGSKTHNIALRQRAIDRGWLLNEYGLFEEAEGALGALVASAEEEEIYVALGLPLIPPTLREGGGEVEAAAAGRLPRLVQTEDIRGDLHYHSDRSGDGRSSIEQMAAAAVAAGWEYVAFTDHGEDLAINGSSREEMLAHQAHIRRVQESHPDIRLLFGCELNIGQRGTLDYDRDFRLGFDWCVASVHSHFRLPQAEQTERLLAAISDPSVHAIGHLTGRYLGRRPGIDVDVEAVLDAMAEHGVALEVNGALERLDAPGQVVRQAVRKGVPLVIDTDSHHTRELVRIRYGVLTAQRGWAEPSHVLNTLPVEELLARRRLPA